MDIVFFFSKYTYEHCCIFDDFIVGFLADSVMLGDTLYANIGETVAWSTKLNNTICWNGNQYFLVKLWSIIIIR
jgi:hypothetical protein